MKILEQKILKDGKILGGDILKVDNFLNHQMDVALFNELGKDIYTHFQGCGVNKILTIEASGIGLASDDVYSTKVYSFTKKTEYDVVVSKEYLGKDDKVLIIDDFLANGNACLGLIDLVRKAGGEVVGVSCAVEKTYQGGYDKIAALGYDVYSLARIAEMKDGHIKFVE